jgi:hypothetical protein
MSFLFGKKQSVQARAEVLQDDHEIMNTEMKKPKYNNYSGREVFIDVAVRVQPDNQSPSEAKMKVGLLKAYLLKPGVRVRIKYDPAKKEQVIMDDEAPVILERNPQLKKYISLNFGEILMPFRRLFESITSVQYFCICPGT